VEGAVTAIRERPARAAAVGGLGLVLIAVALLAGGAFSGSYRLNAVFDQVNGLVEGADVKAAGVDVGSVRRIWLGDDGLPHVAMDIDDGYRVRQGGTAEVRATSASGEVNRYVELTGGGGSRLPDDATLGTGSTDQPVEIGDVLSTFDPRTRAAIRGTLDGLARGTAGRGGDLAKTLTYSGTALSDTSDLVRQVNSDGAQVRTLVSDSHQILSALSADPGALGSAAERLGSVLATTGAHERALARTAALLGPGIRSPRLALDRVDASVGTLRRLVRVARPGVAKLVPFSRQLRPALRAAVPTLAEARSLIRTAPGELNRLDPLLSTAEPTLRTLGPVLRSAAPILDQARVRTPDFFSFFSNWADFTSDYDINGHAAKVGIVLPPAPLNTIGPSDSGPGNLKLPFMRTPGVLEGQPWNDFRSSFIGGGE
jgi:phospholipid/cholesterol/gamma-HCH transport system substrate-binding protein